MVEGPERGAVEVEEEVVAAAVMALVVVVVALVAELLKPTMALLAAGCTYIK